MQSKDYKKSSCYNISNWVMMLAKINECLQTIFIIGKFNYSFTLRPHYETRDIYVMQ